MKLKPRLLVSVLLTMAVVALFAPFAFAAPQAQTGDPFVTIDSPASNSIFNQGDVVAVTSSSGSSVGVAQVELLVDNVASGKPDIPPGSLPPLNYTTILRWTAVAGTHDLTIKVTDGENRTASATIRVLVNGQTQTPTPTPPQTQIPITTTPTPGAATCVLSSRFVADITIPDNTVVAPGSIFTKTWALQNNGTCPWGVGFTAVFISGEQMAGGSPTPIPAALPGQTVNVSVNFVAPSVPGAHRSTWQLQSASGVRFGIPFYVLVQVPGAPPPPPPPTPIPPPPPPPAQGCQGSPTIQAFYVNPDHIQSGQTTTLRWKLVLNADYVALETPGGSGGIATPGEQQINPTNTTTYTLVAYCKGNRVQAQTTVFVSNPPPTPPPQQPSRIISVDPAHQGTNNIRIRVTYFWNGDDPPASMQGYGLRNGTPNTNTDSSPISANQNNTVVLNVAGGLKITLVNVCIVEHSGNEIACGSAPLQ